MARKLSTGCRLVVAASLVSSFAGLTGCASGGEAETARGGNGGSAGAAGATTGGNGGTGGSGFGGSTSGGSSAGGFAGIGGSGGVGGVAGAAGSSAGGTGGTTGGAAGAAGAATGGAAGTTGGTAGTGGAATEVCDGLDNNNNGQVDEGDPGGGGDCKLSGEVGVCADGIFHCVAGSLRCQATTTASAEKCDGLDNDCNGTIDDNNPEGGQGCMTGLDGICGVGLTRCDLTQTPHDIVCEPNVSPGTQAETCNGLDDNCDGSVDEGNPGGGQICDVMGKSGPCQKGVSDCQAGQRVCVQTTFPTSELCDGVDNDCDGALDNAPSGQTLPGVGAACTLPLPTKGECAKGGDVCTGGSLVCMSSVVPRTERCDNKDDDCDGAIDNGGAAQTCLQNCKDLGLVGSGVSSIPNTVATTIQCNTGQCELNQGSCPPGRADANGQLCDGCEATVCATTHSGTCNSATSLGLAANGQITTLNGTAWFSVALNKPNPTVNQAWKPTINLSALSVANGYQMDVMTGCSAAVSCPVAGGTGTAKTGTNITQWSMDYDQVRVTCGGGLGACSDNSTPPGVIYVRITRTSIPGSGSNPECAQFSLSFSE